MAYRYPEDEPTTPPCPQPKRKGKGKKKKDAETELPRLGTPPGSPPLCQFTSELAKRYYNLRPPRGSPPRTSLDDMPPPPLYFEKLPPGALKSLFILKYLADQLTSDVSKATSLFLQNECIFLALFMYFR